MVAQEERALTLVQILVTVVAVVAIARCIEARLRCWLRAVAAVVVEVTVILGQLHASQVLLLVLAVQPRESLDRVMVPRLVVAAVRRRLVAEVVRQVVRQVQRCWAAMEVLAWVVMVLRRLMVVGAVVSNKTPVGPTKSLVAEVVVPAIMVAAEVATVTRNTTAVPEAAVARAI